MAMLRLLLDTGKIDVNAGLFGRSAIWEAVRRGNGLALKILLNTEKVQLKDGEGDELMSLAKEKGDEDIMGILNEALKDFPMTLQLPEGLACLPGIASRHFERLIQSCEV
ncbi:uncharacterized protein K460DRAFT_371079, partial [Cucurbitaria berberidis CBS 394.84]